MQAAAKKIETQGCLLVLRCVDGRHARELFFSCQPPLGATDPEQQAEAVYRAILETLEAEGGSIESVVSETVFMRDLRANLEPVRAGRRRALAACCQGPTFRSATLEIEQAPLNTWACLEVAMQAVLPNGLSPQLESIAVKTASGTAECARVHGLRVRIGDEVRLYAGGLCGSGENAYEQTHGMFGLAEELLQQAGMEFSDVVRAWIHLREMDRDYPDLNRARREFFRTRGIDPVPASTGIEGGPVCAASDLCLGVYAVKARQPGVHTVMTSPTLNEAGDYGADFVRGMRMNEANKVALHVSGTASIDEAGRTAHAGDFEGQADRMLVNVAALLEGQGAAFSDIVSAITYLKHPEDAGRLRQKFMAAGFDGFPNIMVAARVCRPDLLCETEVLAVLPASTPGLSGGADGR